MKKQIGIETVLENILTQKYEIYKVQGTLQFVVKILKKIMNERFRTNYNEEKKLELKHYNLQSKILLKILSKIIN